MGFVRYYKSQYAPNHKEVTFWINTSVDPYGRAIYVWDGTKWTPSASSAGVDMQDQIDSLKEEFTTVKETVVEMETSVKEAVAVVDDYDEALAAIDAENDQIAADVAKNATQIQTNTEQIQTNSETIQVLDEKHDTDIEELMSNQEWNE